MQKGGLGRAEQAKKTYIRADVLENLRVHTMRAIHLDRVFHVAHRPRRQDLWVMFEQIVHDERFWPIVIAVGVVALMIIFAIILGAFGQTGQNVQPTHVFPYPYPL